MLTLNPTSPRPTFVAPAGNTTGGAPPDASADPNSFASLLRHTQQPPAPTPQFASTPAAKPGPGSGATTEPVTPNEAGDAEPAPQESDNMQRARTQLKGKPHDTRPAPDSRDAKAQPAADQGDRTDPAGKPDKTAPDDGQAAAPLPGAGTSPVDPNVMQWLAGLQRAAAGQGAESVPGTDGKGVPGADGKAAPAATDTDVIQARGAARGSLADDLKADAALKDSLAQGQGPTAEAIASSTFATALVAQKGGFEKPRLPVVDATREAAAAGASALAAAPTPGTPESTPVAVPIATPVTAPDFAQELGLRLSTLAKDGVQTAELHLNPADMGPVSVQIVMDGTQARVDFGADMAATRQAIEAGLPELASALADAGFTLAGGGVSQHAGGGGGGSESGSSSGNDTRRTASAEQTARAAGAARRLVTKGGVDLFA